MGGRNRAHPAASPTRRAILALLLSLAGCAATPAGIHHTVRRGENLYRIGKAYGVDYHTLARRNGIADPGKIEVGQRVLIPGASRTLPVEIIAPRFAQERRPSAEELSAADRPLRWPLPEGTLSSEFGPRNGSFHDGIDISAPEGTAVTAALGGRVIYSDQIPGYGNIVIVDHDHGLTTVYAHNSRNQVSAGDLVSQGEVVSLVGRSGRTTGANLHFEVRSQNVARNPLYYLPPLSGGPAEPALR